MSEQRFSKLSSSIDYFDVWDSVEEKGYTVDEVVDLLNEQQSTMQHLAVEKHQADKRYQTLLAEQQATISRLEEENEQIEQMYLNKLDKRERQIDIMKFHILNFCTDEQIQSIRNDLEIESKLRRCKK